MKLAAAELITTLAKRLDDAQQQVETVDMLTLEHADLSLPDAYLIQRGLIACRAARGDVLIGMKMGLTSVAKMKQVGVHAPRF